MTAAQPRQRPRRAVPSAKRRGTPDKELSADVHNYVLYHSKYERQLLAAALSTMTVRKQRRGMHHKGQQAQPAVKQGFELSIYVFGHYIYIEFI